MMRRIRLTLLAVLLCGGVCLSQVPPGIGAGAFAALGVHARPLGMGGAYTAVIGPQPIPYYNPAALQWAQGITVEGMYAQPFGQGLGISLQNLSVVTRVGVEADASESLLDLDGADPDPIRRSGYGAAVSWLGIRIDDIMLWDEDDPSAIDSVSAGSNLFLASASMRLLDNWAVGVSGKLYRSSILEGRGTGVGVDLGLLGVLPMGDATVTLGLNSMDVAQTRIQWRNTEGNPVNYLPWVNKLGVTASLMEDRVLVAGDFDWAMGRPAREQRLHAGVEVRPLETVAIRGGWKGDLEGAQPGSFSGGLELTLLGRLHVSYAYVSGAIGGTHFASFDISF